jgi:PleD family two-component response regulator
LIHERETGNGNMKRIDNKMKKSKDLAAKILIIDDEEPNVIFLETLLEEAGYTNVFSITDSREAVSWFRKVQPDILLLDLTMPYLNGF